MVQADFALTWPLAGLRTISRKRMQPANQSRLLAAAVPKARFAGLDSANDLMPVYDPAWSKA